MSPRRYTRRYTLAQRVEAGLGPLREDGCRLWERATSRGYGNISFSQDGWNRRLYVHRVVWELAHGPIPAGMMVLHSCDTPACAALAHLRLGTQQDNMNDMEERKRRKLGSMRKEARLSEEDAYGIRCDMASGASYRATADKYGCSVRTVLNVWTGHTWKHVAGPLRGQ